MAVRCHIFCDDGCTPSEHEFSLMPRIGNVFVFPGQYAIYEVADVLHDRVLSADGDVTGNAVAVVVRKKPAREVRTV